MGGGTVGVRDATTGGAAVPLIPIFCSSSLIRASPAAIRASAAASRFINASTVGCELEGLLIVADAPSSVDAQQAPVTARAIVMITEDLRVIRVFLSKLSSDASQGFFLR